MGRNVGDGSQASGKSNDAATRIRRVGWPTGIAPPVALGIHRLIGVAIVQPVLCVILDPITVERVVGGIVIWRVPGIDALVVMVDVVSLEGVVFTPSPLTPFIVLFPFCVKCFSG